MSKNREDVLIHTYGPEFHAELLALLRQARLLSALLREHFRDTPMLDYRPNMSDMERTARGLAELENRLRVAVAEMEKPPK